MPGGNPRPIISRKVLSDYNHSPVFAMLKQCAGKHWGQCCQ